MFRLGVTTNHRVKSLSKYFLEISFQIGKQSMHRVAHTLGMVPFTNPTDLEHFVGKEFTKGAISPPHWVG